MKRKMPGLSLLVIIFCLIWGATITSKAVDLSEVNAELEIARQLAGNDKYLNITKDLQCHEPGPDGKPIGPGQGAKNVNAEPTKVFDNVYYVGGTRTGGWLITTSDGYILLDAMYGNSPEETIIPGMKKFGLDPAKIKYILITHPGPDHAGGAKYFQEKYGTQVIMDEKSWGPLLNPGPHSWQTRLEKLRKEGKQPNEQEKDWQGPPKKDLVAVDGQKLTLGDTTITMVVTPRKPNGGGLSYIIPVKDNGETHMWATYGNTGIGRTLDDKKVYRKAVAHFLTYTDAAKVDVVMSSHPFVDGSVERMKEIRNRKPGEPNPFVIGQEAARRYISILDHCCAVSIARAKAGLDDFGRSLKDFPPKRRPF